MVVVEAKTGKAHLSAVQAQERERWEAAGAVYCECRSLNDLEDALLAAGVIGERVLWPRRQEEG